jgi:hypothetical protein
VTIQSSRRSVASPGTSAISCSAGIGEPYGERLQARRRELGQGSVVEAAAIAETHAAPVEGQQGHQEELGHDLGLPRPRLQQTEAGRHHLGVRLPGPEQQRGFRPDNDRQADRVTAPGQDRHGRAEIQLVALGPIGRDGGTVDQGDRAPVHGLEQPPAGLGAGLRRGRRRAGPAALGLGAQARLQVVKLGRQKVIL